MNPADEYITSAEIIKLWKISPRTITRWIERGQAAPVKPPPGLFPKTRGRPRLIFRRNEVKDLIAAHRYLAPRCTNKDLPFGIVIFRTIRRKRSTPEEISYAVRHFRQWIKRHQVKRGKLVYKRVGGGVSSIFIWAIEWRDKDGAYRYGWYRREVLKHTQTATIFQTVEPSLVDPFLETTDWP